MREGFLYSSQTIRNIFTDVGAGFSDSESITHIATSSEEIDTGGFFIPLLGNRDGHEFIPSALSRGAVLFLCERNHPILEKISPEDRKKAIFVKNTLRALGKIAEFHRMRYRPLVLGITGSSGKTTTKEILGMSLSYLPFDELVITEKNYNNEIGVPFTIFKIHKQTRIVIIEMGMNHSGEISRLTRMAKPHHVILTGIGPSHIENLGSLEAIAYAKSEIMEGMFKGGNFYLPTGIKYLEIFQKHAKKRNLNFKLFQLKDSDSIKLIERSAEGYILEVFGEKVEWKIPVYKILENLTAVVDLVSDLGFDKKEVANKLKAYQSTNRRNVILEKELTLLDDTYNANPDSMISSLQSLVHVGSGKDCYAILGDMKELGSYSEKYHKKVGKIAAELGLKGLIGFGADSNFIVTSYMKHFRESKFAVQFEDSEDSIQKIRDLLKSNLKQGDIVLIKGSRSMKMERIVESIKEIGFVNE
ncbi:MAG: UDP-N-acetylmuramoyl-tripeptide--D-alanyl-D-alanine ligase [Leptospiraceae bacterium]|nr:UDP-N-acetylmuramoyl-tripeptide--D-alanyl-D-alanine ligase [Leptospiraceae bacterium]MCP5511238.1 UDP-N-acetylmuramoyl-tripeptide--D-alanyl-D-alanine ligase [Leptospiraceae bacterium]